MLKRDLNLPAMKSKSIFSFGPWHSPGIKFFGAVGISGLAGTVNLISLFRVALAISVLKVNSKVPFFL